MAALNSLPVAASQRQPRGQVKIGGVLVAAWTTWTVDNNSFYGADTFKITLAFSALPESHSADWFSRQKSVEVEILAGFPAHPANPQDAEMYTIVVGNVDDIEFNPAARTLELSGRDLSAKLIDNKTAPEAYRNQTSSDVAAALAKKYGLATDIKKTTTKVGTYWDADHIGLTDQRSEWDVLTYLASQEGFVVRMKGRTLVFQPSPFEAPAKDFYVFDWDTASGRPHFNGTELSFTRSLTVAKGVSVTASSFQTKNKKAITAVYPKAARGTAAGKATPVGGGENHKLRLPPNKSVLEVQQAAKRRHDEIMSHEMHLRATLPADHSLDIASALKVQGTDTAYDQVYYLDAVTRTMSMESGYTMAIRAKNRAPETTPNL